jgi:DEAD/DEAH box helicase domain-containing protein
MSALQPSAPSEKTSLDIHRILGSLVARNQSEEVLTTIRQIPAREAKFRPLGTWVATAVAQAYRDKGIEQLYSHQASTADLVRDGKNVVVVTLLSFRSLGQPSIVH